MPDTRTVRPQGRRRSERRKDRMVILPARCPDHVDREIHVIDGHGKKQTNSYVWIGPTDTGRPAEIILKRSEMRALRDALTHALGEA